MEDGFEVRLHRSGRTISIPPGETILKTLLDAGVDVDFSCAMGGCGTCETRIVEGIPDHRDNYLSDEERSQNDVIMICCSRSKSPVLVLISTTGLQLSAKPISEMTRKHGEAFDLCAVRRSSVAFSAKTVAFQALVDAKYRCGMGARDITLTQDEWICLP